MTGRAHGARGVHVGAHTRDLSPGFRTLVDVRQTGQRAIADTALLVRTRGEAHESAVGIHATCQLEMRAGAVAAHEELVLARQHQVHRPLQELGQFGGRVTFLTESKLATEPAAHVLDNAGHGRTLEIQSLGGIAREPERVLRGAVDGGFFTTTPIDHGAVSF